MWLLNNGMLTSLFTLDDKCVIYFHQNILFCLQIVILTGNANIWHPTLVSIRLGMFGVDNLDERSCFSAFLHLLMISRGSLHYRKLLCIYPLLGRGGGRGMVLIFLCVNGNRKEFLFFFSQKRQFAHQWKFAWIMIKRRICPYKQHVGFIKVRELKERQGSVTVIGSAK